MMAVKPETNCETCKGSISRINFQCKNGIETLPVNQCKYTYLSREEETFSGHDGIKQLSSLLCCAVYVSCIFYRGQNVIRQVQQEGFHGMQF